MLAITAPFPQFFDLAGQPLQGGEIFIGQPNQNPETAPATVYWDSALTQPAAQPIKTVNGVPSRNGTPSNLYASGPYSITIRDANGAIVSYLAEVSDSQSLSVATYGATGDGVTDDTAAIQAAINYLETLNYSASAGGRPALYFPPGKYLVGTLTANKRHTFYGAGSSAVFLQLKSGVTTSLFVLNADRTVGNSLSDENHVVINGMTLIGNRTDSTTVGSSHGIYCPDTAWTQTTQYSPSIKSTDVVIENFTGDGIYFGNNRNWALLDRVIVRYCNDCALFTKGYDGRYTSCDFGVCQNFGIREDAGGMNIFTGCNIYFNGVNIQCDSFSNAPSLWQGCSIDAALNQGVNISGSTGAKKFLSCRFDENSRAGAGLWPDIAVSNGTVSVVDSDFILSVQAVSYLIQTSGTCQVTFQANRYAKTGASIPYTLAVSNTPAALLSSDSLFYNVESWGAVGDGTTDDHVAINAALAAATSSGRTVFFPNATYLCGAQIVADSCRILGDNAQLTFSGLGASTDCFVLQGSSPIAPLDIEGLKINANNTGRDAVVVTSKSSGCDFLRIRRMAIQGAVRDALSFTPGAANYWIQNFRISDTRIYSPGRHGIAMIVPNLSNVFINQGIFDNVDVRGAGQTTASSFDVYCDSQGTGSSAQKISEITWISCDLDAAGAANHAQGSISLNMTGTQSAYDGWTFFCVTPEDTGGTITGFPKVIQVNNSANCRDLRWIGGVVNKYGSVVDLSTIGWGEVDTGSSGRTFKKFDMTGLGFAASYANDAAAAAAGIVVGQTYRNGSNVCVRVS
jgi:hypothetical protein